MWINRLDFTVPGVRGALYVLRGFCAGADDNDVLQIVVKFQEFYLKK